MRCLGVIRRRVGRPGGDQAGFSLIELLMAVIVSGIFAGGLYAFFFASTDAARSSETVASAQADGREALGRFTRDIRQAISSQASNAFSCFQ